MVLTDDLMMCGIFLVVRPFSGNALPFQRSLIKGTGPDAEAGIIKPQMRVASGIPPFCASRKIDRFNSKNILPPTDSIYPILSFIPRWVQHRSNCDPSRRSIFTLSVILRVAA